MDSPNNPAYSPWAPSLKAGDKIMQKKIKRMYLILKIYVAVIVLWIVLWSVLTNDTFLKKVSTFYRWIKRKYKEYMRPPPLTPAQLFEEFKQIFKCNVCAEVMQDPGLWDCGHMCCKGCVDETQDPRDGYHNKCRDCNKKTRAIRYVHKLRDYLSKIPQEHEHDKDPISCMLADDSLEELKCCVCMTLNRNPVSYDCGHMFCKTCSDNIQPDRDSNNDKDCPICRQKTPRCDIRSIPALKKFIRKIPRNLLPKDVQDDYNEEDDTVDPDYRMYDLYDHLSNV